MKIITFIISFILVTPLAVGASGNIKLPIDLPELSITEGSALGSNEQGIGLNPGDTLMPVTLETHLGKPTDLADLYKQGDIMVVFYRGGWCPYCNLQIRQLTEAWPEFNNRGITPVLISADKPDAAMMVQRTYEIPFPVLSDPELVAHKAFNVVFTLPEELISVYKDYGITLEEWSGKNHHQFAVSSTFIIDNKGVVKWAHSSTDYKTRPSVEQLLGVIDSLKN